MFRVRLALAGASILVVVPLASAAQAESPSSGMQAADLHRRALAALPAVRKGLDNQLNDYPTARFRNVHARIVPSVYSDDEGQSNKVPWTHRGGPILVFCGEINAKNRMGGYGGWKPFVFQPAQTDMVAMYDFGTPRTIKQVNVAGSDELTMSGTDRFDDAEIGLLCASSGSGERTDPVDMSELVKHPDS